jgi:hypothetical protein
MQPETIKIIEDLSERLCELKMLYYSNRQLGGAEEKEYLKIVKIVDQASKHVKNAKALAKTK